MKKYLMIFLAVLLFSTAVSAQTDGYIGLFADDTRTAWCKSGSSFPVIFEMYIFCLPRADGMFCAEFMIDYPADPTVITATVTQGAGISIVKGDLASGVSVCYLECQNDWVWPFHQMIVLQSANKNVISIVDHPESHAILFNCCVEPRPIYDAVVFTNLYLQYEVGVDPECSETATAELTWGAIKSIYTE
ncbi:MAG: hypothetical protein KAU49_03625 [Candidatus Krumholzibacteria bacterium]|nr:hypothetical protein [Candidatus Krumholzibacteria bacterium]